VSFGPSGSRPHWLGTLLYPTALLGVFLGGQLLLGLVGAPPSQRASLAAVPAVAALLLSLPMRLRRTWGEHQPWQRLGVRQPLPRPLLRGVIKAALLLTLLELGLAWAGDLQWRPALSPGLLLNGLALGLGVGFAEELLFRGWLLGELELLLGRQRGLMLQATVFSLAHTRFNLPPVQLAGLLGGLLLLGLALGLQRRADGGSLWGAVGLHGGLVGGWFVLNQGLWPVSHSASVWLMGPDNPIGGVLGWFGLALLLLARRRWWRA
jgi:membrane protease YdiL (CAAX protease family)